MGFNMPVQPVSDQKPDSKGKTLTFPWVEPWYAAYALLGISVAGMTPILLPLVVFKGGSASQVGVVMAALSLGGLSAPLWGGLAAAGVLLGLLLSSGLFSKIHTRN